MNSSKSLVPTLQHHVSNYTANESQQLNCSLQLLDYFLRSAASNLSEKRVTKGNFFPVIAGIILDRPSFHYESSNKELLTRQIYPKFSHLKYINDLFHHRNLNSCIKYALSFL